MIAQSNAAVLVTLRAAWTHYPRRVAFLMAMPIVIFAAFYFGLPMFAGPTLPRSGRPDRR